MVKFISSNQRKIQNYKLFINKFNVDFEAINLDLIEVQTDDLRNLAKLKAEQAFEKIKSPLFINDAGWEIPALNNFPGPYMKYINKWLSSEDFLRLMNGIIDRRIILKDCFACVNKDGIVEIFEESYFATIVEVPVGEGTSIDRITKFDSINKMISEISDEDRLKVFGNSSIWRKLSDWIINNDK